MTNISFSWLLNDIFLSFGSLETLQLLPNGNAGGRQQVNQKRIYI